MVGGWHFEDDGWMDDGWCSEKKLKCSSIPLRVACTSIVVEFTDSHDDIRAYQPRQLTVKGSDWSLYKESRSDDVPQITTTNKNQETRIKKQEWCCSFIGFVSTHYFARSSTCFGMQIIS